MLKNNKIIWFFVLGIFLLTVLLRGLEVYINNYVFTFDHGAYYLQVKRMFDEGKPLLISETYTPLPGFFQGPFFLYLLALFYLPFGGDPYGGMVLMFIAGTLAVLISFFIIKRELGLLIGLTTAFIFAVYPSAASASRMIWPPHIIYLLMPFYLYAIIKLVIHKNFFFFWSIFFASVITTFEFPSGLVLYLPILFYSFLFNHSVFNIKDFGKGILAFLIPFFPQIIFNFRHQNIMVNGFWQYFKGETQGGTEKMGLTKTFFSHLTTFKENFINLFPSNDIWFVISLGLILILTIFFYKKTNPKEKKIYFYFNNLTDSNIFAIIFLSIYSLGLVHYRVTGCLYFLNWFFTG